MDILLQREVTVRSLTADKLLWFNNEHTRSSQEGGMSTDGGAGLLELTVNQPLAQPLQLTVTQKTAGVQIPEEDHNTRIIENTPELHYYYQHILCKMHKHRKHMKYIQSVEGKRLLTVF